MTPTLSKADQGKMELETVIRWDQLEKLVRIGSSYANVWKACEKKGMTRSPWPDSSWRIYTLPLAQFRWGVKGKGRRGNLEALQKARLASKSQRLSTGERG